LPKINVRPPESTISQALSAPEWEAMSKNHQSICGDMTIDTATISFANKGDVTFQLLHCDTDMGKWILKISEDVDAGLFMRLGPITESDGGSSDMEVAYYSTLDLAMESREEPQSNASSWGVYGR
jgi:hypothetical protein